jgi:hypothetical protein
VKIGQDEHGWMMRPMISAVIKDGRPIDRSTLDLPVNKPR